MRGTVVGAGSVSGRRSKRSGTTCSRPTLTGVGERSHLLSPDVNLDTHIDDVVNLILWEELSDVVLCGHSYGGCVISGVADRIPDRIGALVYLDAFVLEDGQSLHDTLPPAQKELQLELATAAWGRLEGAADSCRSIQRQCQRSRVGESPVHDAISGDVPTAITLKGTVGAHDTGHVHPGHWLERFAVPGVLRRRRAKGWKTVTIPCGHDVMLDRPEELTRALLDVAEAQPAAI